LRESLVTQNFGERSDILDVTKSILQEVRTTVGLPADSTDFDTDLLMYINSSIGVLNQNGVGNFLVVENEESTWGDLQNLDQVEGNKYFKMIPLFITLNTKLLFDPPPPSSVDVHQRQIDQLLWRLKIAYEEQYVAPIVDEDVY
jgi:hypothetical protein